MHEFLKNILRYPTNFFVFFLIRIPFLVTSLDNKFSAIPFLACVIKREIMITRKDFEKLLRLVPFFEFSQCVAGKKRKGEIHCLIKNVSLKFADHSNIIKLQYNYVI